MCYAKPGPRCTRHARSKLEATKRKLTKLQTAQNPDHDKIAATKAQYDQDLATYFTTPGGQRTLRARIVHSSDEDEKAQLNDLLQHSIEVHQSQLQAYKDSITESEDTPSANNLDQFNFISHNRARRGLNMEDEQTISLLSSLHDSSSSWRENLTEDEEDAVRSYTIFDYKVINHICRDEQGYVNFARQDRSFESDQEIFDHIERLKKRARDLDSAIAKAPQALIPRHLYRAFRSPAGQDNNSYVAQNFIPGQEVTFPTYLSTTVDADVATHHLLDRDPSSRIVFEIVTQQGAVLHKTSSRTSRIQDQEKEILIGRNSTFVVAAIKENITYQQVKSFRHGSQSLPKKVKVTVVQLVDKNLVNE